MASSTYLELAERLAADLERDGGGAKVPSEHELCAAHRVSRPTARAALQELERRFLVRRVRGAGTFVNRRTDYVISPARPPSATVTLRAAGVEPRITVLSARTLRCPAEVAGHLGLGGGDRVACLRRRIDVAGLVTSLTTAYLPAALVPGLTRGFGDDTSLFERLGREYGITTRRRWSRASLEVPETAIAIALELEGRPPAWRLDGVSNDAATDEAIEFTHSWMRADLINVVFEMGPQ